LGKIVVGILGVTGAIGELYETLLKDHSHFVLKFIAASEKNVGKSRHGLYISSVDDLMSAKKLGVKVLFSGLDTETAKKIEPKWAHDFLVISSSSAFRNRGQMILPEINGHQIQGAMNGIFSKPNCTLHPIILSLAALRPLKIKRVTVTTLQAVSGAGKTGLSAMEILDNVIPYIENEEEKIKNEFRLLFEEDLSIDITCCRVAVYDGHLVTLSVEFQDEVSAKEVEDRFRSFPLFHLHEEKDRPQPRLDRDFQKGMGISIGRVRKGEGRVVQFIALAHNRIRGAAGTGIKLAEIAYGFVQPGL
jgi:aspartate-semialdehyde dehydrogenase